jgi:hypothetical protein
MTLFQGCSFQDCLSGSGLAFMKVQRTGKERSLYMQQILQF